MKFVALVTIFVAVVSVRAEEPPKQKIFTEFYGASFGKVWDAVRASMQELGCAKAQVEKITEPAEEGGLYTGLYVSDFCVIARGEDTTKKYMEQFGEVPRIRGGIWITGRIQFKINIKEEGVRQTKMVLRAELSGFEEFITNAVHFWVSNGVLEQRMIDAINAKLKVVLEKPTEE